MRTVCSALNRFGADRHARSPATYSDAHNHRMDIPPSLVEYGGAALVLVLMLALLRWTFGTQNAKRVPTENPDDPMGSGLLEEVTRVPSETAAGLLRRRLAGQGIRATVAKADPQGYRVLVFPNDLVDAKVVLSRHSQE